MHPDPYDPIIRSLPTETARRLREADRALGALVHQLWDLAYHIAALTERKTKHDVAWRLEEALFVEVGGVQSYLHELIEANTPAEDAR